MWNGDIYIWKPFPKRIEEAGIVAQNIEKNYSMGINQLDEMRDKNFTFPFHLSLVDMCESNMGITGGHDLNFFKDYCSMVHGFLEVNRDKLASLSGGVSSVNTIMEQYLMYEYAQRRGKEIECLIPSLPNTEMYKLTLFCLLPKEVSFIHNIGSNKRREIMSDRLAGARRKLLRSMKEVTQEHDGSYSGARRKLLRSTTEVSQTSVR